MTTDTVDFLEEASYPVHDPGIIRVCNETEACASRITREGRRITYRAKIIQQPDRARACGSGAKSCADRRPVDPPPIIELRIFEGPAENEKDITYEYDANFFVFATLEHARHMAPGRHIGSAPTSNVCVLTGSPVAGMALLERPIPAGYFIFPDLSVRHEGKYRLNFSLYEESKADKDMDSKPLDNPSLPKQAHVSHQLEIKTVPFTVFSAKKFPGLTTSTHLSQMFAEQGCRVRIRRDVRMRRRDNGKGQSGFDEEEDAPYQYENRPRASATPDFHAQPKCGTPHQAPIGRFERDRSLSIASDGQRPAAEQLHHSYQQGHFAASPSTPQAVYQSQQPWLSTPPQVYSQIPASHACNASYATSSTSQPMPPPHYGYAAQYHQGNQHPKHINSDFPASSRSNASSQQQPPAGHTAHAGPVYHGYASASSFLATSSQFPPSQCLAPVHTPQNGQTHQNRHLTQPPTLTYHSPVKLETSYPVAQDISCFTPVAPPATATKRTFSSSFDAQPLEQPLRNGARPIVSPMDSKYSYRLEAHAAPSIHPPSMIEQDTSVDLSSMEYRRADGTQRRRALPKH